MSGNGRTIIGSAVPAIRMVFLMWLVFFLDYIQGFDFGTLGIYPRTTSGLIGIITAPLIHGSVMHILSNTFPVLILGAILFFTYKRIAGRVFMGAYFLTNILVWLLARPSYHIGASGLVYGLAAFLISFGIFRRDTISILISFIVLLLYGSIFWGVLPANNGVSWESHLFGAIVGVLLALTFKRSKV